jgi:hypothetical protein
MPQARDDVVKKASVLRLYNTYVSGLVFALLAAQIVSYLPVYLSIPLGAATIILGISVVIWSNNLLLRREIGRRTEHNWFVLDVTYLAVGDIIATRHGGRISTVIQRETGGRYSHVALYIGDNQVFEATIPRARITEASSYILTTDRDSFCVLRPKLSVRKVCESFESVSGGP